MPYNWNAESERAMLLIACAELKPSSTTWQKVADRLGGGLNANAVRCAYVLKFHCNFKSRSLLLSKLRKC